MSANTTVNDLPFFRFRWVRQALALPVAIALYVSFLICLAQGSSPERQVASTGAGAKETTFTLRLTGEPETLDWNKAHTPIETHILLNLMEGLVGYTPELKPIPSLAESWKISRDQKTYTFKIKKGVKWSDGVELTAQDFVFSWKRLLSPLTAASYAYLLFDIEGAEEFNQGKVKNFDQVAVRAPDRYTFEVTLKQPVAHWIHIPTFWVTFPLREDVIAKHGLAWDTPGRMVTLGPFQLSAHDHDSKIVLKRQPHYSKKRGNIEQVVFQIVKDDSTALSLFETGKLDFLMDISSLDLARLQGNSELRVFPYLKTGYLGFVTQNYPLNNVNLRRAISHAIDKTKLGKTLMGQQKAASSFVPPGLLGHFPIADVGLPYDLTLARKELKKSGFDQQSALKMEMLIPNWDKPMNVAQLIQSELKQNLGLNVSIQPLDHKTFRAQLDLKSTPSFVMSWSADYPDPDNFLSLFMSTAGNNRTGWKNLKYDEWVLKARRTASAPMRNRLYQQIQHLLLNEEAVIVPLFYEPNLALVKNRVRGLFVNPLNYLLLAEVNLLPESNKK